MGHVQNVAVTGVIKYNGQYLLVKRSEDSEHFPGLWAFPGGRIDLFETAVDAIRREIYEETKLELNDECAFLDTFSFDKTVGFAFLVCAKNGVITLSKELTDYSWITELNDMDKFNCIPGIYNHLVRAIHMVKHGFFDSLEEMNLTEKKYINL